MFQQKVGITTVRPPVVALKVHTTRTKVTSTIESVVVKDPQAEREPVISGFQLPYNHKLLLALNRVVSLVVNTTTGGDNVIRGEVISAVQSKTFGAQIQNTSYLIKTDQGVVAIEDDQIKTFTLLTNDTSFNKLTVQVFGNAKRVVKVSYYVNSKPFSLTHEMNTDKLDKVLLKHQRDAEIPIKLKTFITWECCENVDQPVEIKFITGTPTTHTIASFKCAQYTTTKQMINEVSSNAECVQIYDYSVHSFYSGFVFKNTSDNRIHTGPVTNRGHSANSGGFGFAFTSGANYNLTSAKPGDYCILTKLTWSTLLTFSKTTAWSSRVTKIKIGKIQSYVTVSSKQACTIELCNPHNIQHTVVFVVPKNQKVDLEPVGTATELSKNMYKMDIEVDQGVDLVFHQKSEEVFQVQNYQIPFSVISRFVSSLYLSSVRNHDSLSSFDIEDNMQQDLYDCIKGYLNHFIRPTYQATAGGLFGAPAAQQPTFGVTAQQPSFGGAGAFGTTAPTTTSSLFGSTPQPSGGGVFGFSSPSSQPFGTPAVESSSSASGGSLFGTSSHGGTVSSAHSSLFGASQQTSAFGAQQQPSAFCSAPAASTVFGATSPFGAPQQTPAFGAPQQTPAFGAFGASQTSAFGAPQQQQASLFGSRPATSTGAGGFGLGSTQSSTFGGQSHNLPYAPYVDTTLPNQPVVVSSISASGAGNGLSHEELRLRDNTKKTGVSNPFGFANPPQPQQQYKTTTSTFGFGATSQSPFGAASQPSFGEVLDNPNAFIESTPEEEEVTPKFSFASSPTPSTTTTKTSVFGTPTLKEQSPAEVSNTTSAAAPTVPTFSFAPKPSSPTPAASTFTFKAVNVDQTTAPAANTNTFSFAPKPASPTPAASTFTFYCGQQTFLTIAQNTNATLTKVLLQSIYLSNASTLTNGAYIYAFTDGKVATTSSVISITIDNCHFVNGRAGLNGGAIYFATNEITPDFMLSITDSKFINNTASIYGTGNGAAIVTAVVDVIITGCNFTGNSLATDGYAVVYTNYGFIAVSMTTFTNNVMPGVSVFHSQFANGVVDINNVVFSGNSFTSSDGMMVVLYQSIGRISASQFINNTQSSAIFLAALATIRVDTSTFIGHSGTTKGGVIRADPFTQFTFTNCTMTNNSALYGGAIYSNDATLGTVIDCIFNNNYAYNVGGAIFVNATALEVTGGLFINNESPNGNDIYCNGSSVIANNVTVTPVSGDDSRHEDLIVCQRTCQIQGNSIGYSCGANPDDNKKKRSGLSNGQIAGIIIGVFLGIGFIAGLIWIMKKRHHNRTKYSSF
eukprot:gene7804-9156_t